MAAVALFPLAARSEEEATPLLELLKRGIDGDEMVFFKSSFFSFLVSGCLRVPFSFSLLSGSSWRLVAALEAIQDRNQEWTATKASSLFFY